MPKTIQDLTLWVVTEGIAGTENQCIGVAEALGITPIIHRVKLRQPWKSLSPYLGFENESTFDKSQWCPAPPWPDLVIASGRKAIAAANYIKQKSPHTFITILQDPRVNTKKFDLVAVPTHDPSRGDNIIQTFGAPNRLTPKKLIEAKSAFPTFEVQIKKPRVAVLIGGSNKIYTLTDQIMDGFIEKLKSLSESYGLMITASRRTGEANLTRLKQGLAGTDAYLWDNLGPNPYFAFLAYADYIIVTADSVSMISEAATTGKPVYMLPLQGISKRFSRFYSSLQDRNCLRIFDGTLDHWSYEPLNEAKKVADTILTKLAEKGIIHGRD